MNNSKDFSLINKEINPFHQLIFSFGLCLIIMLCAKLYALSGSKVETSFYWMTAGSFLLFFTIFNSVLFISAQSFGRYYRNSIISFAILLLSSTTLAKLLSGISVSEQQGFRQIFIALIVGYLALFSIGSIIKRIIIIVNDEQKRNDQQQAKDSRSIGQ